MTDASLAPARPHGSIQEILEDVFIVRGTHRLAPLMTIPRTMTIVRDGDALTVINAVRLSDEGERELAKLGRVRDVVKLGHHHGVDHPYYVQRHGARLWATPDATHEHGLTTDARLTDDHLPIEAELFRFERSLMPEAALILPREGGLLVTCDSVQSWPDMRGCSIPAKLVCLLMGFRGDAVIGPGWRKACEPRDDEGLAPDFDRLLARPFRSLVDGHGTPLLGDAWHELSASVEEAYGRRPRAPAAQAA